ncbi:PilW family protein [Sporosarcina sp. FSL K6-3457]|uniref:PilW family protein n=1 Tax=Sporosarcina sp. FSL K6-3457 TaxID=2978204 RepID=UPI0030F5AB56
MENYTNNERGLTLVELLAVIAISSVIILLILNVHVFGQKQYKEQSTKAEQLYDVSYVAKIITKEIRKSISAETDGSKILILNKNLSDEIIFKEEDNQIFMNAKQLVRGQVNFTEVGGKIAITIKSKERNDATGKVETKEIETEIYMR